MPRPKKPRKLQFNPDVYFFKPHRVPLRQLKTVYLQPDEIEAIKLHDVDELDHIMCAENMGISQPTFGRILDNAYKKIAKALVNGWAIRIKRK